MDENLKQLFESQSSEDKIQLWKWLISTDGDVKSDEILAEYLDSNDSHIDFDVEKTYRELASNIKFGKGKCLKRAAIWSFRLLTCCLVVGCILMAGRIFELKSIKWAEASTGTGETREMTMPDGSLIKLGPCSKIVYPSSFSGNERVVFLSGSAYAYITKTKRQTPFIISLGDIETVVTGTEFQIDAYEGNEKDVISLVEGSLLVRKKGEEQGVYLSSGYLATYDKKMDEFTKKAFDAQDYKQKVETGNIVYFNKSFSDIAVDLEKRFGVRLIFDDSSIKENTYFASFINREDYHDILQIINIDKSFRIVEEEDGKTIRIYAK